MWNSRLAREHVTPAWYLYPYGFASGTLTQIRRAHCFVWYDQTYRNDSRNNAQLGGEDERVITRLFWAVKMARQKKLRQRAQNKKARKISATSFFSESQELRSSHSVSVAFHRKRHVFAGYASLALFFNRVIYTSPGGHSQLDLYSFRTWAERVMRSAFEQIGYIVCELRSTSYVKRLICFCGFAHEITHRCC